MLDSEGFIKLVDFGLSKKLTPPEISSHSLVGTIEYMSPEMIAKVPHSFSTDLWTLGIITYEMLTGKLPFEGRDRKETQQKILT